MEENNKIILSLINKFKLLQTFEFLLMFILGVVSIGGVLFLIFWFLSPLLNFSTLELSFVVAIVNVSILVLISTISIAKIYRLKSRQRPRSNNPLRGDGNSRNSYQFASKKNVERNRGSQTLRLRSGFYNRGNPVSCEKNIRAVIFLAICIILSLSLSVLSFTETHLSIYFMFVLLLLLIGVSFLDRLTYLLAGFNSMNSAIRLEQRAKFNGEIISAVDFFLIKDKLAHNKGLEHLFIKKLGDKLKSFNIIRHFNVSKPILRILLCVIPVLVIASGQLLFSYKPTDAINDALTKETLPELQYDIHYKNQVLYGEEFFVLIKTNAELTTMNLNYNAKEITSVPKEYKGNIDKLLDRSTKSLHHTSKSSQTPSIAPSDEKIKYYLYSMDNVVKDFTFSITFSLYNNRGNISNQEVKIIYLPEIEQLTYTLRYPTEYKLEDYTSKGDGNIQTFANSIVNLEIKSNNPLDEAVFVLQDTQGKETQYEMNIKHNDNPTEAKLNHKIEQEGRYYISLTDDKGYNNQDTRITYTIDIIEDNPPIVELLEPQTDFTTENLSKIPINVHSQDDIEVSLLRIEYSLNKDGKLKKSGRIPLNIKPKRVINHSKDVNFAKINAKRGDRIEFYVRAVDSKGQSAVSEKISITYPDEYDVLDSIKETQKQEEEKLKELVEEQKRLKEELETLYEEPKENNEAIIKKIEELLQREKNLIKEINKTKENLESLKELNKIKEKQETKEEESSLDEKIEEINKLLEELNKEKATKTIEQLKEMMENPQEAMQNISKDKQQMNEEEYIKKLEKAIEKLKTLKDLSTIVEAKKIAKQSLKEQQDINNDIKTKDKSSKSKLDKLSELTQKLESKLNEVEGKQIKEKVEITKQDIENLNKEVIPSFKDSAMKKEDKASAMKSGVILENRIKKAIEELNTILKQASGQHIVDLMNFLNGLVPELITLNKNLNGLDTEIKKYKPQIDEVRQELISKLIEEILFIRDILESRKTKFDKLVEGILPTDYKTIYLKLFEDITANLEDLATAVNERRMYSTKRMMDASVGDLNKLTMEIIKLKAQMKEQMQNSQGQGGDTSDSAQSQGQKEKSQGQSMNSGANDLNALADAQQRLTKETENFIGQNKDGKLSEEEKGHLENLGEEQDAIGKRLDNVIDGKLSEEKKQIKQDIEQMQKEIDEIAKELKEKNIDYDILERQKQVIKRMFETKDEIETIEYKKERQAQLALEQILSEDSQTELEEELKKQLSKQDIQNLSISEDLDPEYIQYIKDYFKRLNEE